MKECELVIPVVLEDLQKVLSHYDDFEKHLPIKKTIFIGNQKAKEYFEQNDLGGGEAGIYTGRFPDSLFRNQGTYM